MAPLPPPALHRVHTLREENEALKAQVVLLSKIGESSSSSDASAGTALRVSLMATAESVRSSESRCLCACLATELSQLEGLVERTRLQSNIEREELALRCEQLGTALEQRVLLAERTQHDAVAAARRQSAEAVAQLEAQLEELSEQMASRDALADAYGVDAELAHADMQRREATAKAERESAISSRLRDELERVQRQHADELRLCEQRAEAAYAEAAQSARALQASEAAVSQLQAQLARLSEGFNKQVEEVLSLEARLEKQKTASVDKAMARSWVVNFVEQRSSAHGDELLKMMADWWEVRCT
jgi:hypothetical protein